MAPPALEFLADENAAALAIRVLDPDVVVLEIVLFGLERAIDGVGDPPVGENANAVMSRRCSAPACRVPARGALRSSRCASNRMAASTKLALRMAVATKKPICH